MATVWLGPLSRIEHAHCPVRVCGSRAMNKLTLLLIFTDLMGLFSLYLFLSRLFICTLLFLSNHCCKSLSPSLSPLSLDTLSPLSLPSLFRSLSLSHPLPLPLSVFNFASLLPEVFFCTALNFLSSNYFLIYIFFDVPNAGFNKRTRVCVLRNRGINSAQRASF